MVFRIVKGTYRLVNAARACLMWAALLAVIFGGSVMAQESAVKVTKLDELKRERKRAAHRKRRIIFDNDGNEPVYYLKEATPEALLACRTTPLLGSQVDSIFYCTWSSPFGTFTHNTKVGEVFDTTVELKHPKNTRRAFSKNKTAELIKQGTDPLKIMVEFCKRNRIEIFWSMRMNDTHDAASSSTWYGGGVMLNKFKRDHPEYLLGSKDKRPKRGAWTAVDYGRKEIRDLAFRFHEEVCENYDVDGVELDFFRHLNYFKRPAMGQAASQEDRDKMTSLIRRIRRMTERAGLKRGRPILVAVRVPDSVGYCEAIGFDIVRWMKEDLIDILVPSGYFRLNHWEVSVQLARKYGVAVYPCLSESRVKDREARRVRASLACYRARATNVWDSAADGVYMFNSFNPRNPLWRELGDPEALETMDKVYCTGARGVRAANSRLANGVRFLNRQLLSPERPVPLKPGESANVELRVGQHVRRSTAQGLVPEVTLRLRVKQLPDAADLSVKLNDKPLSGGTKSKTWLDYSVSPATVRKGMNRFEMTLNPGSTAKPVLQDLLLWVRYKKGA